MAPQLPREDVAADAQELRGALFVAVGVVERGVQEAGVELFAQLGVERGGRRGGFGLGKEGAKGCGERGLPVG